MLPPLALWWATCPTQGLKTTPPVSWRMLLPLWLHLGLHFGFVMAISLFSGSTLDIMLPISYLEEIALSHGIVEDVASSASYAGG